VAGCCECGDEPSGSCAMELVNRCYTLVHAEEKLIPLNLLYWSPESSEYHPSGSIL
jgi:NMD protein affecting ribosome stability and mRNA decay